jgi:uncharacterized repeat protein (TIGR02543 family)
MKRRFFRVSSLLFVAGMLSFSCVATSCGDDDDEEEGSKKVLTEQFTITYDLNGGSGSVEPTYFRVGERILLADGKQLTAPAGKVFEGWSTSKDKMEYNELNITGNQTLYAIWKDLAADNTNIQITFDLDGGRVADGVKTAIEVEKGEDVDLTAIVPTKDGFAFKGWAEAKGGEVISEFTADAVATLYAVWEQNVWDLTTEGFSSWTAWVDGEIKEAAGCELVIGESTGLPYGDGSVINYIDLTEYSTLVLVVSDGEPRFMLNRDVDEGQAPDHLIAIPNDADQTAAYETVVDNGNGTKTYTVDLAKIVADWGYAHLHAIKGANWANVTVESMKITKDVGSTPVAVEKVKITFDLNGGKVEEGVKTTISVEKGKAVDLTAVAPTRPNYILSGWSTEKDGAVVASFTADAATTLYAVWEKSVIDLPTEGFSSWTAWVDGEIKEAANCEYVIGESTGLPYGDGSVINYIDISAYKTLVLVVSDGEPRFMLNRDVDEGQAPDHLIAIPNDADQTAAYETVVDNGDGTKTYTIDLAKIVEDKGYAHLHAIKGANWANVTVESMQLTK